MKQAYSPTKRVFDLNFFLCGNSGSGKTHFAASYTAGPIHFYMLDVGGHKTIEKCLIDRPAKASQVSVDIMSGDDFTFSKIYRQISQDEREGLFTELAAANGIVVLDSLTTLNEKAKSEIAIKNNRVLYSIGSANKNQGLQISDWGQLGHWMNHLIKGFQDLPCATITTVHLHTIMDGEQTVVGRYPSLNGQLRQTVGVNFDETYLLEMRGDKQIIHFKEHLKFEAKSRSFSDKSVRDCTMDDIYQAYTNNQTTLMEAKK